MLSNCGADERPESWIILLTCYIAVRFVIAGGHSMIGLCSLDGTSNFVDGIINEANQVLHSVLAYGLPAIVTVVMELLSNPTVVTPSRDWVAF